MKLSPSQIATIQHFFQDKPVKKVYLFGSYAPIWRFSENDLYL